MKSLIIMAIPGSGKTSFSKKHKDSFDFDGWFWENVALPNGYKLGDPRGNELFLKELDKLYKSNKYKYILCPILLYGMQPVRNVLLTKYKTLTIYPFKELKNEWMQRLKDRGDHPSNKDKHFIPFWESHFIEVSDILDKEGLGKTNYVKLDLRHKYLEDGFNIWKKRIGITVENCHITIDSCDSTITLDEFWKKNRMSDHIWGF